MIFREALAALKRVVRIGAFIRNLSMISGSEEDRIERHNLKVSSVSNNYVAQTTRFSRLLD